MYTGANYRLRPLEGLSFIDHMIASSRLSYLSKSLSKTAIATPYQACDAHAADREDILINQQTHHLQPADLCYGKLWAILQLVTIWVNKDSCAKNLSSGMTLTSINSW